MFIDGAEEATIGQYANYGPNNEVYLAQGQAISFKLTGNTNEIASIQIGAKAPNGAATMVVEGKVSTTTRLEQQLNTATEMYYNITEQAKDGQLVTISNTGNGILSLTNLKITYKTSGQTVTLSDLTAEEQANAVAMVQALFAAPVETVQPERFDASWGGSVPGRPEGYPDGEGQWGRGRHHRGRRDRQQLYHPHRAHRLGLVVPQGHLPRIYLHRHRSCPDHGLRSLRSECGRYCQ